MSMSMSGQYEYEATFELCDYQRC
eukprot:SAG11_NODE_26923_length_339_cov_0.700000_1_plen_23_part_10